MDAEPLQADQRWTVDDPALVDPGVNFLRRGHEHADVLVLVVEAVQATRFRGARQPKVEFDRLAGSTGAGEDHADALKVDDFATGLLDRLAARHLFGGFALV